jgi:hypothetical protein
MRNLVKERRPVSQRGWVAGHCKKCWTVSVVVTGGTREGQEGHVSVSDWLRRCWQ